MDENKADNEDINDNDDKTYKGDESGNDKDHKSYVGPLLIELQQCQQRQNSRKSVRWSSIPVPCFGSL